MFEHLRAAYASSTIGRRKPDVLRALSRVSLGGVSAFFRNLSVTDVKDLDLEGAVGILEAMPDSAMVVGSLYGNGKRRSGIVTGPLAITEQLRVRCSNGVVINPDESRYRSTVRGGVAFDYLELTDDWGNPIAQLWTTYVKR